jgi:hypothetical protein
MRTFITFPTPEEAAQADTKVAQYLREKEGSKCSQWSGIYTDGKVFGILYDATVEAAGITGNVIEAELLPYEPPAPEPEPEF